MLNNEENFCRNWSVLFPVSVVLLPDRKLFKTEMTVALALPDESVICLTGKAPSDVLMIVSMSVVVSLSALSVFEGMAFGRPCSSLSAIVPARSVVVESPNKYASLFTALDR